MFKIIMLFILLPGFVLGQDCIKNLGNNTCVVRDQIGKFGVRKKDKYIVPSYFDQLLEYSGKYFAVEQNGKWGIFNIKGNMLLPVAYTNITVIDAEGDLINGEGCGYNNLIITERVNRPANCGKVNPFVLASNSEVTIAEYLTFMADMKKNPKNDFSYEMTIPELKYMAKNGKTIFDFFLHQESNTCTENYTAFSARVKLTVDLPCSITKDKQLSNFLTLPITGISFKQAQRFCLWLTEKYNVTYASNESYEILVRLPRPLEWEELAVNGLDDAMKTRYCQDSLNNQYCFTLNCKHPENACSQVDEQTQKYGNNTVPVYTFRSNMFGLYNLFGNVAEMTLEEGVCKGGSYAHFASQCLANKQLEYHGPTEWLGFRFVIEYKIKKEKITIE